MNIPQVTQKNLRPLLPSKIAMVATYIAQENQTSTLSALTTFYKSKTYAKLEKEPTKYWWMSAPQLYHTFHEECKRQG